MAWQFERPVIKCFNHIHSMLVNSSENPRKSISPRHQLILIIQPAVPINIAPTHIVWLQRKSYMTHPIEAYQETAPLESPSWWNQTSPSIRECLSYQVVQGHNSYPAGNDHMSHLTGKDVSFQEGRHLKKGPLFHCFNNYVWSGCLEEYRSNPLSCAPCFWLWVAAHRMLKQISPLDRGTGLQPSTEPQ